MSMEGCCSLGLNMLRMTWWRRLDAEIGVCAGIYLEMRVEVKEGGPTTRTLAA